MKISLIECCELDMFLVYSHFQFFQTIIANFNWDQFKFSHCAQISPQMISLHDFLHNPMQILQFSILLDFASVIQSAFNRTI